MEKLIFFFSHPLKGTLSDLVMACNFSKMSRQQGVKTSVNIWNNQAACTQRLARCVEAWRRASLEVLLLPPVSERNAATVLKERLPGSVMNKSTLYLCKWVLLSDNRSRKISTVRIVFLSRTESRESTDRWLVHGQYRLLKIRKSHILIWSENEALCQKEKKRKNNFLKCCSFSYSLCERMLHQSHCSIFENAFILSAIWQKNHRHW